MRNRESLQLPSEEACRLATRLAHAAYEMQRAPMTSPEAALRALCAAARHLVTDAVGDPRGRLGVWAAISGATPTEGVKLATVEGYEAGQIAEQVLGRIKAANPLSDLPRSAVAMGAGESPEGIVCILRRVVMSDPAWAAHPYAGFRRALALEDFVRLEIPLSPSQRLLMQVDGLPEDGAVVALAAVHMRLAGPFIQASYRDRLERPERHRETLLDKLTPAQRPVLASLLEGRTIRQIGLEIHRSEYTVHDHVKGIYQALGVHSRVDLLRLWVDVPANEITPEQ